MYVQMVVVWVGVIDEVVSYYVVQDVVCGRWVQVGVGGECFQVDWICVVGKCVEQYYYVFDDLNGCFVGVFVCFCYGCSGLWM